MIAPAVARAAAGGDPGGPQILGAYAAYYYESRAHRYAKDM